jgi:hypothetical protein
LIETRCKNYPSSDEQERTRSSGSNISNSTGVKTHIDSERDEFTIQIQNQKHLGPKLEMNQKETSGKLVELTTGRTSAAVASKIQMTPLQMRTD